jgi:hypothetical protein
LKRCVLDIVMGKPAEVSRSGECVWHSHGKTCSIPPISTTRTITSRLNS